jgi:uncharacterized repeat protein (TIGR01451 family)
MKSRAQNGLGNILLITTLSVLFFTTLTTAVNAATIYVPSNPQTIQEAVDEAYHGATIIVRNGTYNENVKVNKRLRIRSEYGPTSTIVRALDPDEHVFRVIVDHVDISGFTVTGATGYMQAGIHLGCTSNHSNIYDNIVSNNSIGISLASPSNNNLMGNIVNSNNRRGIYLHESSNYNTLTGNIVYSNNKGGIYLKDPSNYNLIYNNYFNNLNNAQISGINIMNTTITAGTNIIGGPYLGGNYWSDYAGEDLNADGFGDTLLPYDASRNIKDSGDWHPLVLQPDIAVTKVGNVTEGAPSTLVNFTIKVNNTVNCALIQVTAVDTLPAGMSYVSSTPVANVSAGRITWTGLGPVAAGATKAITLVAHIDNAAEGVLNNSVNVTGSLPIGDDVHGCDIAQVIVLGVIA